MSNKRIVNVGIILVLTVVLVWSVLGILKLKEEDTYYHVSVILNDSYNESWTLARNGMEQAAKDNHIILNYLYTNSMENAEEQMELIKREEENGAQGIITKLLPVRDQELSEELNSRKNLILMDCMLSASSDAEQSVETIGPDYYNMGRALANRIYSDFPKEETDLANMGSELRIGLIIRKDEAISQIEKRGFLQAAKEKGISVSWIMESDPAQEEQKDWFRQIDRKKQVDVLVALENELSEWVVDYVEQPDAKNGKASLYGIGFSEKLIYYLDRGRISALAVPDEFNLGYQSVQALAEKITGKQQKSLAEKIRYALVDKATLYDEENEKMLFPITQ